MQLAFNRRFEFHGDNIFTKVAHIYGFSLPRDHICWYILTAMSVTMNVSQPAQAPQRFVEQNTAYHLDAAGPDPELKKLLPLVFASIDIEANTQAAEDAEIFAPMFVDKTQKAVRKSVSSQKALPIPQGEIKGISTYFSGYHPGLDYRARVGASVDSILPGVVNEVGFERGGYGRYVIVVHHVDGKTLFSLYAHLRSSSVSAGDIVEAGQKLGEIGLTGRTTGPHLHFELHDDKRALDPRRFFAGGALAMVSK